MSKERKEIPRATPTPTDMPARIRVVAYEKGTPDASATELLLLSYWWDNEFHCPRCKRTFTDPNDFVEHLAEEINEAMLKLARPPIAKENKPTSERS